MNNLFKFFLFSLISFSSFASEKACVLNFERRIHPFTKKMEPLKQNKNIILVNEAVPFEIVNCIKKGVEEITIIAHSFQIDKTGKKFRLGYFKEIKGEKRSKVFDDVVGNLNKEYEQISQDLNEKSCSKSRMANKRRRRFSCNRTLSKLSTIKAKIEELKNLPADYPIYDKKLFYNRIFKRAINELQKQKIAGKMALKSIRLMGCTPDEVISGHPDFGKLVSEFDLNLDIAPKQKLMSFIKGKDVTTMDERWLLESAQFEEIDSRGFYAYINLKTKLLKRYGETTALRGKYKVEVNGLALGFASKWSTVFIEYAEVENLKVGETIKIKRPQFDLQLGLWLNGEVQLSKHSTVLGPKEINSLGASVGIYQEIKITKLY